MKIKKNILTLVIFAFYAFSVIAQSNVSISDKPDQDPHDSAILDLISDERGFLMTRIAGNDLVDDPEESLIIYNSSTNCFEIYLEAEWHEIWCYGGCIESTDPTEITGDDQICDGSDTDLSVVGGSLGTGASWIWYSDGCGDGDGGTFVEQGATITVDPTTTTTYYVRAEGDCATTTCVSFEVEVIDVPDAPAEGTHVAGEEQIQWNWNTVADADKYYWNDTDDPNTATDMGTNTSHTETGLDCETSYTRYVWAYNDCGFSDSQELTQTTDDCAAQTFPCEGYEDGAGGFEIDYEGKTYELVEIGDQCWFAENMDHDDGCGDVTWITSNLANSENYDVGWCGYYNDNGTERTEYGLLYQWSAANLICPDGWRLPTDDDWKELEATIGMSPSEINSIGERGDDNEGDKLKDPSVDNWCNSDDCDNEFGFSALPGGRRTCTDDVNFIDERGYWWNSTLGNHLDEDPYRRFGRNLFDVYNEVLRYRDRSCSAFSVRCIKGERPELEYCISRQDARYDYITNVTIQGDGASEIDNTTGTPWPDDGYSDYYDTHDVTWRRGQTYDVSVTIEQSYDPGIGVNLYVDWNRSGHLGNEGEFYVIEEEPATSGTYTGQITVPADANLGETRMRVVYVNDFFEEDNINQSCVDQYTPRDGETQDYKVIVID